MSSGPEIKEQSWSSTDLEESPHEHAEKGSRVQSMFNAIAHAYDLNNRLHSFGRDQAWRRHAVRLVQAAPEDEVLDVACGTGDLSEAFHHAGVRRVVGLDYTGGMLEIARRKSERLQGEQVPEYVQGDAMDLPFDSGSFDVVSIAFGIRNVVDPDRAFREFARVLRPGGRLVVLEFAEPRNRLLRLGNAFYTRHVMPFTASLIARDRSGAYRYLPKSIQTFLDPDALGSRIAGAGFEVTRQVRLTFGVCAATVAVRKQP
ncbi:MAG: bifunctional demethylmenaquinone methyltransferase/2-methoxy-6-polyprenyl-1,4-benzoquinol methylase UbiE [Phycisphaerales bacterium]|nr:bifunctional demethylmenaquinone methyltransferase/2-methoxy-6-polyprenyl-1,4-benzoquinol methylase UbiE [Phycisphaerales bacterium]